MVSLKIFSALAAIGSVVSALPEPKVTAAVNCAKVTGALSVLKKLGPPATSFCSSYLKVPATKTILTTTIPTVTSTTSTSIVTITSTACPGSGPVRRRRRELQPANLENRGKILPAPKINILPALALFAAAKVSEGCNCLGITPKATTIATVTAVPQTSNVVAISTTCVPPPPPPAPVCAAVGAFCNLSDPGACCSLACCNYGDVAACCVVPS